MVKTKQIPLQFEPIPCLGREDFMVNKSNAEAVSMINLWPDWPFFALCIYGPQGSGKTHLANIFAQHVYKITNHPYKIPSIEASEINMDSPHRLFEQSRCLIVENIRENINQEAMFHLYNLYRNEGGNILFTAQIPLARMNFSLKDLQSRLNIIPAVELKAPDDELLSTILIKLFSDRQMTISPEILSYIINNMQRSNAYAIKLIAEIDNICLARKRAISIPIVKEALESVNNCYQGELF